MSRNGSVYGKLFLLWTILFNTHFYQIFLNIWNWIRLIDENAFDIYTHGDLAGHIDMRITESLAELLDNMPIDEYNIIATALAPHSFIYPHSSTVYLIELHIQFANKVSASKEWLLLEKNWLKCYKNQWNKKRGKIEMKNEFTFVS